MDYEVLLRGLRRRTFFWEDGMNLEEIGIPYTDLGEHKSIELFWHISNSLVSKTYLDEILQLIVTMTAGVMQSKICSLMLLDEAKGELKIVATQSLSSDYINKPPIKVTDSVSGRTVREKKPIIIPDITKEKNFGYPAIAKKEGIVSMLSVPMIMEDRVIGVINCYTHEKRDFTPLEVKIMQSVASQAAVAIEKTKLREEAFQAKQALEERKTIDRAKALVSEKDGLKESEAYEFIQKTSRDNRKSMVEVANAIILVYGGKKK